MQARADSSEMVFLTGISHPDLAKLVSERLEICLGDATIYNKTTTETSFSIKHLVRGKHLFIFSRDWLETVDFALEFSDYGCQSIYVIIPFYSDLIDHKFAKYGINHMVSFDMNKRDTEKNFSGPVGNIQALPLFLDYIKEHIPDYETAVIVAKSPGVMGKATSYAERLRLGVAVIHGEQKDEEESGLEDGRQSPPLPVTTYDFLPAQDTKQKPPLTVVRDVRGRIAIMVDDIIDDAQSFVAAAEVLKARGAYKIYVIATHGVLSSDAPALLEASPITEVIVTNTIPHELQKMRCPKIKTVDVCPMICRWITTTLEKMPAQIKFSFKNTRELYKFNDYEMTSTVEATKGEITWFARIKRAGDWCYLLLRATKPKRLASMTATIRVFGYIGNDKKTLVEGKTEVPKGTTVKQFGVRIQNWSELHRQLKDHSFEKVEAELTYPTNEDLPLLKAHSKEDYNKHTCWSKQADKEEPAAKPKPVLTKRTNNRVSRKERVDYTEQVDNEGIKPLGKAPGQKHQDPDYK